MDLIAEALFKVKLEEKGGQKAPTMSSKNKRREILVISLVGKVTISKYLTPNPNAKAKGH